MDGDFLVQRIRKPSVVGPIAQKADPEKGIAVSTVNNAADLNVAKYGGGLIIHTPNPSSPAWEIDIVVIRSRKEEATKEATKETTKEKERDQSKTKQAPKSGEKPDGHDHDANLTDTDAPPPRLSKEAKREAKGAEKDWLTTPTMLPFALPTARIMEFPYSSEVMKQKNSATISKLASQFLQSLETYREPCPRRPIIYIAHDSGGEILRVAFESHVKTYLGPRFDLEELNEPWPMMPPPPPPPPPGFLPQPYHAGRGPPPGWPGPPSPPPPSSPPVPSKLSRFLPRLITHRSTPSPPSARSRTPSPPPSPPPISPPGDARPPTPTSPRPSPTRPSSPRSRTGTIEGQVVRTSQESYSSLRPLRLQVPMFETDSLRIVIGVVFLEYNTDREVRTGFLRKLSETGIPVQWYLNKKYRARGRLPMFPADFLQIHELEFAEPGSLRAFANPEDEENYARVRTEIQSMCKCDSLLDAAYRNDIAKIEALVAERLHPDRPRANGNSPIHIAARLGHMDAIATFLKHGADITGKTSMGDTPLRIAAEMAYPAVVKLLLEKGAPTDIFGNSGFDFIRWSQGKRRLISEASGGGMTPEEKAKLLEVCDLLENPPLAEGPSLDGQSRKYYPQNEPPLPPPNFGAEACRTHGIIVADFFVDSSVPNSDASSHGSEPTTVTHQKEFRIIKSHSVQKILYSNVLQTSSENTQQHIMNKIHGFTWYHIPANNTAWVEGLFVRLGIQDWLEIDAQEHRGRTPHSRVMMAGINKLDNNKNEGNISFFAPFLNVELNSNQKRMAKWIQKTSGSRFWRNHGPPNILSGRRVPPEKYLINAYLDEYRGLHIRRTLDQSHYSMLPNTSDRDKDQVLHRHRDDGPPAVVMVDQLWLWIIDDILITSFPLKMDHSGDTGLDVLDSILQYVRGNDRKPILTAHDLASIIIEKCSGVLNTSTENLGSPYDVLDVFGSAIGKVSNEETGLMKKFHANVLKLNKLRGAKDRRKPRFTYNHFDDTSEYSSAESGITDVSSYESSNSGNSSRVSTYRTTSTASYRYRLRRHQRRARKDPQKISTKLLNSFNNIAQETTQLIEIKDIKDELGMLMEVLSAQQQAIEAFSTSTSKFVQKDVLPRTIAVGREQIQKLKQMSEQSEDIFKALNHLLDLKQKQANASEARTANVQAMQADKQGKTLMVFTTVTIIFLPLSFMAAFFAMPIINFPKKEDGTSALTLGFVSKFIFPISIAISVPFLVLAFSVNSIENTLSTFSRRANAAALTKARWNSRQIVESTGWARRKAQFTWFCRGLWRWAKAMVRPKRSTRRLWSRFRDMFRWRRVKRRARRMRRRARSKGLWRKKRGGSDGVVTESESDTWSRSSRTRSLRD